MQKYGKTLQKPPTFFKFVTIFMEMKNKIQCIIALLILFSGISRAQERVTAEDYFIEAIKNYTIEEYDKAAALLHKTLSVTPSNDAAHFYLGLIELKNGEYETALGYFNDAMALSPENEWYKSTLARIYSGSGETERAIGLLEELRKEHPGNVEYHFETATLYMKKGMWEEASECLDRIEDLRGVNELTLSSRYEIFLQTGKRDEAVEVLKRLDKEYPSPVVAYTLGEIFRNVPGDTTYYKYYERALEMSPGFTPAKITLADSYRARGEFPTYFSEINKILSDSGIDPQIKCEYLSTNVISPDFVSNYSPQLDTMVSNCITAHPTDSTVLSFAGEYYVATARNEHGKAFMKKNIELYPESVAIWYQYFRYLYSFQQWNEMIEAANKALEVFKGNAMIRELLAMAYWQLDDLPMAAREYKILIKEKGVEERMLLQYYASLGDVYYTMGKDSKAFSYYEKGLKIDESYTPILNNYAYYLSLKGTRLKKALSMSRKTVEQEPTNSTYLDTYGWLLFQTGDLKEAKKYMKLAIVHGGKESAVIVDHYAEVLYALGEHDLAMLYWSDADKLDPSLGIAEKIRIRKEKRSAQR